MKKLSRQLFEDLLDELCKRLTSESQAKLFEKSKVFENRVREVAKDLLEEYKINVDFSPHPYGFPDIALQEFGIEVKFSENETWRSIANSVFETFRDKSVKHIYVVFGKMNLKPEVRWGRYEDCVIHVRTSHVPRFEVDVEVKKGSHLSLFHKFGITYDEFTMLSEDAKMGHIRKYAEGRLKPGERLWWLGEKEDSHSMQLNVELFANLSPAKKLRMRAEASLLCPQICGSSRNKTKYTDPILYMLTYHGILASRDAFSAGSAAGPERGGIYVQKALKRVETQMIEAAEYLEADLFKEYWKENVAPKKRVKRWLELADYYARAATPAWTPSECLFKGY
jgi:hypothetical protein